MRLLGHNLLASPVAGVQNGFPLAINARKVEEEEREFAAEYIVALLPKIHFGALKKAVQNLGLDANGIPESAESVAEDDEETLKTLHHFLLELDVIEGDLICPESGKKFPISNGVPNLIVQEES